MEGASYARHACLRVLSVVVVVGVLAGCHHGGEGVKDVSTSGSATGARASQSPDDLPLWEQPELLAKYPVRAKKNPDGSYDYSDPKFENADLCKEVAPKFWTQRGYTTDGSDYSDVTTLKDCFVEDENKDVSTVIAIGTDKKKRKDVAGRLFKQYRPDRFDQIVDSLNSPACVAYVETDIGRIGVLYGDIEDTMSEAQLCEKARENLKKVSK